MTKWQVLINQHPMRSHVWAETESEAWDKARGMFDVKANEMLVVLACEEERPIITQTDSLTVAAMDTATHCVVAMYAGSKTSMIAEIDPGCLVTVAYFCKSQTGVLFDRDPSSSELRFYDERAADV